MLQIIVDILSSEYQTLIEGIDVKSDVSGIVGQNK